MRIVLKIFALKLSLHILNNFVFIPY
jgi:hypothetical protein